MAMSSPQILSRIGMLVDEERTVVAPFSALIRRRRLSLIRQHAEGDGDRR